MPGDAGFVGPLLPGTPLKWHRGGIVPSFHDGGYVPHDTLAQLQAGEVVIPRFHDGYYGGYKIPNLPEDYATTGTPLGIAVGGNYDRWELSAVPESARQMFELFGRPDLITPTTGIPYSWYQTFGDDAEVMWISSMMGFDNVTQMDPSGRKMMAGSFSDTKQFRSLERMVGQNVYTVAPVDYPNLYKDYQLYMMLAGMAPDLPKISSQFWSQDANQLHSFGWIDDTGQLTAAGKDVMSYATWYTDWQRTWANLYKEGTVGSVPEEFWARYKYPEDIPRIPGVNVPAGIPGMPGWDPTKPPPAVVPGYHMRPPKPPSTGGRGTKIPPGLQMHDGGLAPDEIVAVLQRGEAVIPERVVAANRELIEGLIDGAPRFHGGALPSGGGGGGAEGMKVRFNLVNETGVAIQAKEGPGFFDADEYVKTVTLKALRQDSRYRAAVSSMIGG